MTTALACRLTIPCRYSAALNSGTSLSSIRQTIAGSPEARSDLNGLFHQILGRDAESAALVTYTASLGNGSSLASVELILAQSPEAQSDLKQIYQDVLNRAADGGGLATYTAQLGNGGSLDGGRSVIAHSPEAQSDLKTLFQNVLGRAPGAAELVGMEDQLSISGATQTAKGVAEAVKRRWRRRGPIPWLPTGSFTFATTARYRAMTSSPRPSSDSAVVLIAGKKEQCSH